MILKFETLFKKSEARGAYGFRRCESVWPFALLTPLGVFSMPTMSEEPLGRASPFACGHIGGDVVV